MLKSTTKNSNPKVREQMSDSAKPPYSIFTINVSPEYRSVVEDMCRMTLIQVMVNSLFYLSNPNKYPFFSSEFFKTLLFIIVGVVSYWLIFRRIVSFGPEEGYDRRKFYYGGGN